MELNGICYIIRLFLYQDNKSTSNVTIYVVELCVDYFNVAGFDTSLTGQSDLDITRSRLDRLDVTRAAAVSRETCASPTSLVLALVYLERLRGSNPTYLHTVSSADLFLVSLVGVVIYIDANKEAIVPFKS